ncbi:hypothetical protein [Haloferula sargassicola]|uniref:Uncharacterized protein n=1 Tax=Haloferula sargassicola TaxID=490096 RepID=A0ABP9UUC8_9BACT
MEIKFEEIGAQINLDFDKRSGPRGPHCEARLPRSKVGRRALMDGPMPHGSIIYLTFPTVQGFCRSCERYVTTCPQEVHSDCHLAADEAGKFVGRTGDPFLGRHDVRDQ